MAEEKAQIDPRNAVVLDANILIRAVLGTRVRVLIEQYADSATFLVPTACVNDAREYLPDLCAKRGWSTEIALQLLDELLSVVSVVENELFVEFEQPAKRRIGSRDIEDWPVVALALAVRAPVWTEDTDFFGSGVATWKTDTVEMYLSEGGGLKVQDSAIWTDMPLYPPLVTRDSGR